jgi:hypothetical protein
MKYTLFIVIGIPVAIFIVVLTARGIKAIFKSWND